MDSRVIDCLMRQTSYTREEAVQSLERNKTLEEAIKEYLGVKPKEPVPITVNQGIFKSIRDFIDNED
jgi:uncharacterized protein with ATP-grasp and redox domains